MNNRTIQIHIRSVFMRLYKINIRKGSTSAREKIGVERTGVSVYPLRFSVKHGREK